MKITKRQLKGLIREVIEESYTKYADEGDVVSFPISEVIQLTQGLDEDVKPEVFIGDIVYSIVKDENKYDVVRKGDRIEVYVDDNELLDIVSEELEDQGLSVK